MGRPIVQSMSFTECPNKSSETKVTLDCVRMAPWNEIRVQGVELALLSLVLFCLVLSPGALQAATSTAASCSRADVGAALDRAANGDTVFIPAGTCTWTTNYTISGKYLTLQGAGIGQTVITDGTSKDNFPNIPQVLIWETIDGGLSRLTGITFQGGSIHDIYGKGIVQVTGQSRQFRLDHCRFNTTETHATYWAGGVQGVVDHNTFDLSGNLANYFAATVNHHTWTTPGTNFGDVSWATPDSVGTAGALFFEDNIFRNDQSRQWYWYATDSASGARVVYRRNNFQATIWSNHGTESGGRWRGTRQYEVYDNTWTGPDGVSPWNMHGNAMSTTIGARSGVGVIFNNIVNTTNGMISFVTNVASFRDGSAFAPWGQCNGTSAWDRNTLSSGYLCLDQTGAGYGDLLAGDVPINKVTGTQTWPHQAAQPTYEWNNMLNGVLQYGGLGTGVVNVQIGRDFIHGGRPGYTPFTYPHPLVTSSGATNPPPAPPQSVTVR